MHLVVQSNIELNKDDAKKRSVNVQAKQMYNVVVTYIGDCPRVQNLNSVTTTNHGQSI